MMKRKAKAKVDMAKRLAIRAIRERHYAGLAPEPVTEWGKTIPVEVTTPRVAGKHIDLPEVIPVASDVAPTPDHAPAPAVLRTAEPREEQASITIPGDWQSLGWPQVRRLAASVSDTPILNRADADAAIRAELARRA